MEVGKPRVVSRAGKEGWTEEREGREEREGTLGVGDAKEGKEEAREDTGASWADRVG